MENYIIRGGDSLVHSQILFSDDSKFVFCPTGCNINVYSLNNEECCIVLKGHLDRVTSVIINPLNKLQILSSSLDGELIKWDFSDNVLLKRFKLDDISAIHKLFAPNKMARNIYAIVYHCKETKFVKISLIGCLKTKCLISNVNPEVNSNDMGALGTIFAFKFKRNIHVYHLKNKILKKHRVSKSLSITCIRCHPTEACLATGLSDGKIYIWRDLFPDEGKNPVTTIIHWHALPLRCLTFTPEGSCLLSGSYECVLVKWQMETLKRETLPRLGSPLINISISPDGNLYALSHIDNGIQIITNTFKFIQTFQGLVRCHKDLQVKNELPLKLTFDPRTESIVLNGGPGQLQFYNWKKNIQLFRLDVVGENYISPENLCNPLDLTEVLLADFDLKGDWLATVEGRSNISQTILKFWAYDKELKSFNLNTCFNCPHENELTSLMFQRAYHNRHRCSELNETEESDSYSICVTASKDCTFKIWNLIDATDIYKSSVIWKLRSTGSKKKKVPTATLR